MLAIESGGVRYTTTKHDDSFSLIYILHSFAYKTVQRTEWCFLFDVPAYLTFLNLYFFNGINCLLWYLKVYSEEVNISKFAGKVAAVMYHAGYIKA